MSGFSGGYGNGDTAWIDLTNTVGAGVVQIRRKGGMVSVRMVAPAAATNSGTTYTVVSSGTIPSALRPGKDSRGACDFSGFPGTLLVAPDGSVLVAQNSGALRASCVGMCVYPVE
jgi:hypothetical protein